MMQINNDKVYYYLIYVDFADKMFFKKLKKREGIIEHLTPLFKKMLTVASAARHLFPWISIVNKRSPWKFVKPNE
jgi:hypothetical protein